MAAAVLVLLIPAAASAQYFERNKVRYGSFNFSILQSGHFRIYHYPEGARAVMDAERMLEQWYSRHSQRLDFDLPDSQKVIIYDSFNDYQQTNAVPGLISQGEGGVTESEGGRIVLYLPGIYSENSHVLGHELVHAFQFQKLNSPSASLFAFRPPLWFIEGMAEYFSLGPKDTLTDMWMKDAVLNNEVPSLDQLSSSPEKYFPYRFGGAVWAYIDRRWGQSGVRSFFNAVMAQGLTEGIKTALGEKAEDFSKDWKNDLVTTFTPEMEGRSPPKDVGRMLPGIGNALNLSPVISPDGKYLAVFSRRDLFTIDLFLTDASSGKVLSTLASSDSDARFDALVFVDSSGTWSPDSRSFAFIVTKDGRDAVAVTEVPSGKLKKVVPLGKVDGVSNLAWSPDGRFIALSATKDAIRDLYLLDPETGKLEQLTSGWHAELQPAWSPDGTTLAFATDVGAKSDLQGLDFGSMNIGLMDLANGEVKIISLLDGAVNINPLFSPDGKSLYFVSDAGGFADLYRYDLGSQAFYQATHVSTGISGLTGLSPCVSLAERTGGIVFTVFNKRNFEVHVLSPEQAAGSPVTFEDSITVPTVHEDAPEADAGENTASSPAPSRLSPYRPQFGLVSVSQANLGLTISPVGVGLAGGVELLFEDVLRDQEIDITGQLSGSFDTIGGQFIYYNSADRINWGVGIAHLPQQVLFLLSPSNLAPGADTGIVQQMLFQEEADVVGRYPLSTNRRLEADAGYTRLWYEQTAPVYYYRNGALIGQDQISLPAPPALDLFHASLAYVGDYSYFGFTDPVSGYRYRFEVEQTFGSLLYLTALADMRLYLSLKPVTFAFRGLHYGNYLSDADNPNMGAFYLGLPDLVRGYDYYSVTSTEYAAAGGTGSPQLDRLFGSKIAAVNAELRIPVLGNEELGLLNFPYLPLTLVGFFDGGIAWTNTELPDLELSIDSPARIPVFSVGAAVRINVLNVLVLQIYWAYPFQRPLIAPGGEWGFVLEQGW
jgi:Tol biopolymer transport system component